jgi:hypothetical protein
MASSSSNSKRELLESAENGNLAKVQEIIRGGVRVNTESGGATA